MENSLTTPKHLQLMMYTSDVINNLSVMFNAILRFNRPPSRSTSSRLYFQYIHNNKEADNDWLRIQSNKEGTRWFGKCWYIQDYKKYEFELEFDVSLTLFHLTFRSKLAGFPNFMTEDLSQILRF